jgi:hypothetical protein
LAIIGLLLVFSISSGCAGPLFSDSMPAAQFCYDIKGGPCKMGQTKSIAILGIYLDQIDITTAMENGGITKPISVESVKGHGLISMAKFSVWGE